MRTGLRWARQAGFVAATLLVAACTSTSLVNMWKNPVEPRQPMHSLLVVTLRKSNVTRRVWEDGFVTALKSHGIDATPSYALFPNAAPDTTSLLSAVREHGFDGVLVAHQLSATTRTRYVPGYMTSEPATYVTPWTGHYYGYFADIYSPGYIESDRVVRYEVEVWAAHGGGQLVWSGTTESINPQTNGQINSEIAGVIVPALVKSGVMQTH
jgi:hypothetical protein